MTKEIKIYAKTRVLHLFSLPPFRKDFLLMPSSCFMLETIVVATSWTVRGVHIRSSSHLARIIQAFFEANFQNYMKWRLLTLFVYRRGLANEFTQLNMPTEYCFILYSQPCVELLKPPSGLQDREVVGKTLDATRSKCLDKHLRELSHSLTLVSQTFSRVLVKTYLRSSLRQILLWLESCLTETLR